MNLLRTRNVTDIFVEKIKHTFYIQYRFPENHDVFEINYGKYVKESDKQ